MNNTKSIVTNVKKIKHLEQEWYNISQKIKSRKNLQEKDIKSLELSTGHASEKVCRGWHRGNDIVS